MSSTSQVLTESDPVTRLEDLEKELADLQDKIDDLENRSRRNNLCFAGSASRFEICPLLATCILQLHRS